jgi:hypothetical protein
LLVLIFIAPELPDEEEPLLNMIDPLTPLLPLLCEETTIDPLEEEEPCPPKKDADPPVELPVVLPELMTTAVPTEVVDIAFIEPIFILPPFPPTAFEVMRSTVPDTPCFDPPEYKCNDPETCEVVLLTTIDPEDVVDPTPLEKVEVPPVNKPDDPANILPCPPMFAFPPCSCKPPPALPELELPPVNFMSPPLIPSPD